MNIKKNNKNLTTLADHGITKNHKFNLDNIKIIQIVTTLERERYRKNVC